MKAIVLPKYGRTNLLQLKEVARPSPKENEVLVKIHAAAVNDYDWSLVRGRPYLYRLMFGIGKPKKQIPGIELAGTVEALGSQAHLFKIGEAVYGDISEYTFGALAEYISIDEKALTRKPSGMSFEEAASLSHASMLALQGLRDIGKIQLGQKVLINGAGGGVGTFAVQIAKLYKTQVTGVDTGKKLQMMKSIGFDQVIDYQNEDFTKNGQQYHLILDTKTNRSPFAYLRSLQPKGIYVTVGGSLIRLLQCLCLAPLISLFSKKNICIVALKSNKYLDYIHELYEAQKLRCIIDGPYSLNQAAMAIQHFGDGKHAGKVVLII